MKKLSAAFYKRQNVLQIAKDLLGKIVRSDAGGIKTMGRIVETEGYIGISDRASHSFNGRRTNKNEHMYAEAGTVYVYICYGMHQMLNVVTNKKDLPDAVLIRAIEPLHGLDEMYKRTGKMPGDFSLGKGPGNVCKALGINKTHSGKKYGEGEIELLDDGFKIFEQEYGISKRIGVEGAGEEAAAKPYRFYLRGNKYVSGSPRK